MGEGAGVPVSLLIKSQDVELKLLLQMCQIEELLLTTSFIS